MSKTITDKMDNKSEKNTIYKIIIENITGIFFPIINIITGASILKSAIVLMSTFGLISTESGIYQIFYAVSDGFFYFLPFFLAITASKQWNTDPFISILIPVAMLYPDITRVLENNSSLSFAGLNIPPTIYHSSVIPVLLAVGLLVFIDKLCEKILPNAIKGFMKPIICCLIILPFTFLLFGPIGSWIGDGLTRIFFMLYEWNPIVAGGFMGFVMQPMVVIGAHWSVVPVSISNIAAHGYDVIMPLVGGAVYGQSGAALAVAIMSKNNKERRQVAYQASLTAALGVTEPALFGVNVPMVKPMIAACIAGLVGGCITGIAGTHCNSFAFPSFLTSVAYVGPGFAMFLASMVISFVIAFVLTFILYKGKISD